MNRLQLALECLEVEKAGGSVREYLKARGCISPWGTWFRLQKEELGRAECNITDGKGGADMRKITLEQKQKAVEIAISGGNPLPYLKECGSKKPESLWYTIKKNLEQVDPEKFSKLPERVNAKKEDPEEKPETVRRVTIRAEDLIMKEDPPVAVHAAEDDFRIYGIKTKIGDFQAAGEKLCWYTPEKETVNLPVEEWKRLMEVVPKILNVMAL